MGFSCEGLGFLGLYQHQAEIKRGSVNLGVLVVFVFCIHGVLKFFNASGKTAACDANTENGIGVYGQVPSFRTNRATKEKIGIAGDPRIAGR
jgi:hypothetical protein